MKNKSLEEFYETVILTRYTGVIPSGDITWVSHGKVDLDAYAHYFQIEGKEFVLLYEDFPDGSFLKDGLSHKVVKVEGKGSFELKFSDESMLITNVIGWFTLFEETLIK